MTPSDPTERIPSADDPDATEVVGSDRRRSRRSSRRDSTAQLEPVGAPGRRGADDPTTVIGEDAGDPARDVDEAAGEAEERSRFAASRSRVLRWDAGYCGVAGVVLVLLWADGRAIEGLPDWSALGGGVALIAWAGVLWGVSFGRVAKATTLLVGMLNLAAGSAGFAWGWFDEFVSPLVLVVAGQVAVLGLWQLLVSVRR